MFACLLACGFFNHKYKITFIFNLYFCKGKDNEIFFFILVKLDPPDSHSLFLKGATVSFLNDEIWNLSNIQQGKYLYILLMVTEY